MILLKLFWAFFKIGLLSIGGGYAAIPIIQEQIVERNNWLTKSEFMDVITISQMTPGPIAINSSTFVGIRIAGFIGAVVATIGCILPSCVIVAVLAWVYAKYKQNKIIGGILSGIRPAVVGLITSSGVSLAIQSFFISGHISISNINIISVGIFIAAFFVLHKWKISPVITMCLSGGVGLILYRIFGEIK